MAHDFIFDPGVVYDDATGQRAVNSQGDLYDVAGGMIQPVYDLNGNLMTRLASNVDGYIARWRADISRGVVKFGNIWQPVISTQGQDGSTAVGQATAAAQSATDAKVAAQAAQTSATQAAGLVGAPADDAIAAAINGAGTLTHAALDARYALVAQALGWAVATNPTYAGGADPTGVADSSPALQAAFNAAKVVYVPAGSYRLNSTVVIPLGGTLRGAGVATPGSGLATVLRGKMGAAGGRVLDGRAGGCLIEGLAVVQDAAAFDGCVVDFTGASLTELRQVLLSAQPLADLIRLDQATYHESHKVNYTGGNFQVVGKATQASFSNTHLFVQCRWGDSHGAAFKNVGQAWTVVGGASEYRYDGSAGFVRHDPGVRGESFSVRGLWMGDITAPGPNVQIQWSGDNLHLDGNFFGWNDGTLLSVDENGCNGIVLDNNQYNAFANNNPTYAVDFGVTTGHSGFRFTAAKIYTPLTQVVRGALPAGSLVDVGTGLSVSNTGSTDPANLLTDDDAAQDSGSGSWNAFDVTKNTFSRVTSSALFGDTACGQSQTIVAGPQDVRWQTASVTGKTGTGFMAAVKAGYTYTVSQWVTALDNQRTGDLIVQWYNATGAVIGSSISSATGGTPGTVATYAKGTAAMVWGTFVAPATAAFAQVQVRAYGTVNGDRFRFGRTTVRVGTATSWHRTGNSLAIRGAAITQVGSNANAATAANSKGAAPVVVNGDPNSGTGGLVVGDGKGNIVGGIVPAGAGAGKVTAGVVVRPRAAQTLAAAGAVTIDASLGDAVVTLAANATSSTIATPAADQDLRVTWVQDATGGRTYVWPTNCRFAGAAPVDTTVNARTTVTFRYDATAANWYEVARSVAVI